MTHTGAPLVQVPSLDALARDPHKAEALPLDAVKALLTQCHLVQGCLVSRLLVTSIPLPGEPDEPDTLLTPEEVATILSTKVEQVYGYARRKDWERFTRRLSRKCLRFSKRGLDKWLAAKKSVEQTRLRFLV